MAVKSKEWWKPEPAWPAPENKGKDVVVTAAKLIDGNGGPVVDNPVIVLKGDRIVAVGKTADVRREAAPNAKVIDLKGRTVIPGLIDNHSHWIRAAEHDELRFDGVTTRKQALKMLADRLRQAKPGQWVVTLGGWSEEQFTDDPRGFPLAELDRIAPGNPVAIQSVYNHTWLNSAALNALDADQLAAIETADIAALTTAQIANLATASIATLPVTCWVVGGAIATMPASLARGAFSNDNWYLGFNLGRKFY